VGLFFIEATGDGIHRPDAPGTPMSHHPPVRIAPKWWAGLVTYWLVLFFTIVFGFRAAFPRHTPMDPPSESRLADAPAIPLK